jgi:peptidoglycan/xylan/chitin deacetylase (PgdA/CDA1 family)
MGARDPQVPDAGVPGDGGGLPGGVPDDTQANNAGVDTDPLDGGQSVAAGTPASDAAARGVDNTLAPAPWQLFLTFDDGPLGGTDDVLNNLRNAGNVASTFFILGSSCGTGWRRQQLGRIVNEAHLVGNHGDQHIYEYGNAQTMIKDFDASVVAVQKACQTNSIPYPPTHQVYARLPGSNTWRVPGLASADVSTRGHSTQQTADALARKGFSIYGWDIEWEQRYEERTQPGTQKKKRVGTGQPLQTPDEMANQIVSAFTRGRMRRPNKLILLTHDILFRASEGNGTKVQEMIQTLKQKGITTFRTLKDY